MSDGLRQLHRHCCGFAHCAAAPPRSLGSGHPSHASNPTPTFHRHHPTGKKGVSLNPSEAEALLAAAAAITTAAGGVPADLPPLEPSALLPTAGSGSAASGATAKASASAGPSKAAAAAAAAPAAGTVASGEPTEVVELGSNKRLSISHFGGRTSVDLREFYDVSYRGVGAEVLLLTWCCACMRGASDGAMWRVQPACMWQP